MRRQKANLVARWTQPIGRRRLLRGAGFFGAGAALAWVLGCRGGDSELLTTLDRAIALGEDGVLGLGPGEPYEVRTELAEAQVGREERRRSLVAFHHFADLQLLDEESPLRGEWQDSCPVPLSTSAFRPQEALTLQVAASLIRQANRVNRSPLTNRAIDFVLHTGNAADNAQFNELRWFIDLMDGRPLQPDSGGAGYEGVQSESPDQRYPDLLALAQLPFVPQAIRYPWYTAVGSRDVLAQGSFPPDDASRQIAVGGEKVIDLSPVRKEEVCEDPSILLDPELTREILADEETEVRAVTPDANRRLLSRQEWIEELFNSWECPGPLGHGLTQRNLDEGVAHYVFEHGPLTFIVLDTINRDKSIVQVDLATGNRTVIADAGTGTGPELLGTRDVAYDAASDRVLVVDDDDGRDLVIAINPTTLQRTILAQTGVATGIFFEQPVEVLLDEANDRLLVVDVHPNKKAIFVIHGRNAKAKRALFQFLRSLSLQPIEWSQMVYRTGTPSP